MQHWEGILWTVLTHAFILAMYVVIWALTTPMSHTWPHPCHTYFLAWPLQICFLRPCHDSEFLLKSPHAYIIMEARQIFSKLHWVMVHNFYWLVPRWKLTNLAFYMGERKSQWLGPAIFRVSTVPGYSLLQVVWWPEVILGHSLACRHTVFLFYKLWNWNGFPSTPRTKKKRVLTPESD